jgi:hypothetical protein
MWRTGHCLVPWLEHLTNWLLSGFLSARPLKFIGLSVRQRSNDQLRLNGRLRWLRRSLQRRSQKTVYNNWCHRTVRCCKSTEDFNGQSLQISTVSWCGTHQTMNSRMSGWSVCSKFIIFKFRLFTPSRRLSPCNFWCTAFDATQLPSALLVSSWLPCVRVLKSPRRDFGIFIHKYAGWTTTLKVFNVSLPMIALYGYSILTM